MPVATITETAESEAKTEGCAAGYTGSLGYRRTITVRGTQFPWDAAPVMQRIPGPWILDTDNCLEIVEPDWGDSDVGDYGGGPGGAGAGDPGGDSCDPSPDDPGAGQDACSVDNTGFDASSFGAPDSGGGNQDAGGCFLTGAIVAHRGVEGDNGPTLTALRAFRDSYMMRTAERRALAAEYYATAPAIAAAIPRGHPDWDWIGGQIDAAVAAIGTGDEDAAFRIYVAMVRRLATCWSSPDAPDPLKAGTGKGGSS